MNVCWHMAVCIEGAGESNKRLSPRSSLMVMGDKVTQHKPGCFYRLSEALVYGISIYIASTVDLFSPLLNLLIP